MEFLRLKSKRGPKKAILAVAASILTAAYHMLKNAVDYQDLGANHFDDRDREAIARRPVRKLASLGYAAELRPAA